MIGTAPLKPTHETNIRELKFIFLNGSRQIRTLSGRAKSNHEYTNEEGGNSNIQHFMRINEKSEAEEHDDLAKARSVRP